MQPEKPNPHQSVAGQAETGRACPYCRFPLKESVQIVVCAVCNAPHHADCWQDNGGCAVIACAGGPTGNADRATQAETPTAIHPTGAAPPPQATAPPPSPLPPPPPHPASERRNPSLAAAVIILALAVGGAAVAIVLSRKGNEGTRLAANTTTAQTVTVPASTPSTPTATTSETTSVEENANTTSSPSGEGLLPAVSEEQMQSAIQHVLLEWHEDVVAGNYHAAWELLSQRKQAQDGREYGYSTWVKNQSTLRPYLNPSGLQVSIEHTEPSSGVVQVNLTGMGWDKPGSSCTEWSGITWVKYEQGTWRYDPGYSTTPQRERQWKPRFSELLGGRC